MKYGTFLIGIGLFNSIVIFSGLPTSWKKFFILVFSLAIIGLGYLMRAQAKRRKERIMRQADHIESVRKAELSALTEEIAEDISDQVEQEIDRL